MMIGYARVSTDDQNLDLQRDALREVGCERVFEDQGVSGAARDRLGLDSALAATSPGDGLVVWKLDRLGRSLPHFVETLAALGEREISFRSLSEAIDIGSAGGRLVFHLMAALAEFERALIVERTTTGIKAAKARGIRVDRRKSLTAAQVAHARLLLDSGERPGAVARSLGVSRATLYRALAVTG